MTTAIRKLSLCASLGALASLALIPISEADAQRRGGGGSRASGASMSRPSGGSFNRSSAGSSRQVRSSASPNINYGNRGKASTGAVNTGNRMAGNTGNINSGNRANINTGNAGNRTNINTGNINTGDININRDVHVDAGYGCCHSGWGGYYHPVATGVAIGTAAAVTAAVIGSYYATLPTGCVKVYRGSVTYYQCGTAWYQPVYSGMNVQYVVVAAP